MMGPCRGRGRTVSGRSRKNVSTRECSVKASVAVPLMFAIYIACGSSPAAEQPHRPIPYPRSAVIERLVWESRPSRYPGSGSDMHWWTWGIDGATYVVDDDGA